MTLVQLFIQILFTTFVNEKVANSQALNQ